MSAIIVLIACLVVVALACWGVQKYLPTPDQGPKNIICLLLVVLACLMILAYVGIIPSHLARNCL